MFLFAKMLDSPGKILIVFAFWLVNYAVVSAHPLFFLSYLEMPTHASGSVNYGMGGLRKQP